VVLVAGCVEFAPVVRIWPDLEVGTGEHGFDGLEEGATLDRMPHAEDVERLDAVDLADFDREGSEDSLTDGPDGSEEPDVLHVEQNDSDAADGHDVVIPGEGQPGEPCVAVGDCLEGVCLDTVWGRFCVPECSPECPEGWVCNSGLSPSTCVPVSPPRCRSCAEAKCPDAWCRSVGLEGDYCMTPCVDHSQCPANYSCREMEDRGYFLCQPLINSCQCLAMEAGLYVPCQRTNEYGSCPGMGLCAADLGLIECTAQEPEREICDNRDNNCNGLVDETFPDKGRICDGPDPDWCMAGTYTCGPTGEELVCTGDIAQEDDWCGAPGGPAGGRK
jgi:hypothetical protein